MSSPIALPWGRLVDEVDELRQQAAETAAEGSAGSPLS